MERIPMGRELEEAVQPNKLSDPMFGTFSVSSAIEIGWAVKEQHIKRHVSLPSACKKTNLPA
jgi:hypothetical protein